MRAACPDSVRSSLARKLAACSGSGLPLRGVEPVSCREILPGASLRRTDRLFPRPLDRPNTTAWFPAKDTTSY